MTQTINILLVGCGKMGSALLLGWQEAGIIDTKNVVVIEPNQAQIESINKQFGIKVFADLHAMDSTFVPTLILFAVKPQIMSETLSHYAAFNNSKTTFLSIAAGKTLPFLGSHLGETASIVRAMPNLPATIGEGMTVLTPNDNVSGEQKDVVTRVMQTVGEVIWNDDESVLDAVTAISGSGPAYLFHFVESMQLAAEEVGLEPEMATLLVMKTLAGSLSLASMSSNSIEVLRENVTSPGGTTEAALDILMNQDGGLKKLLKDAVVAATNRSKDLSK